MNRDGSIGGVIVVSLNPEHFTNFYDKIDLGLAASIAMIGSDGVVRASGGSAAGRFALGQDLTGTSLVQHFSNSRNSIFEFKDAQDPHRLLMALRKVRGYPLWVSVGVRKDDVLQPSLESLEWNSLTGVLFTMIILAAMEQILRSETGARQKSEQLKLTLEHMNQGIMLVTKDHDIPVINKKCGELLELPVDFIDHPLRLEDFAPLQIGQSANAFRADFGGLGNRPVCAQYKRHIRTHPAGRHGHRGSPLAAARRRLRADLYGRYQTASGRSLYRQARVRRSADWIAEPACFPLLDREGQQFRRPSARTSPCCSSISIGLRSSTIRSAIASETCC